jgi:alpha-glucosidase
MSRTFSQWAVVLVLGIVAGASAVLGVTDEGRETGAIVVRSPDGRIDIALQVPSAPISGDLAPFYHVSYRGKQIIGDSPLGMTFKDGGALSGLSTVQVHRDSHDQTWPVIAGKSATARDHFNQATILLSERDASHGGKGRQIEIELRAYDDGVAFRYHIPEQPALKDFAITSEDSCFAVPSNARAWVLPVSGFATHYEFYYQPQRVSEISPKQLIGLPLLLELPDGGPAIGMTEANLVDYAGMYLEHVADPKPRATSRAKQENWTILRSALSPLPGQEQIKVKGATPHDSPWRVIMIGDSPGRLIESNLVLNLSDPCAIADTSWIKPGKVAFLWWNGYLFGDNARRGAVNTATYKAYVDEAAEFGFAYSSIDGLDVAWYGGRIPGYGENDITVPIKGLDIQQVLAYAKSKGVRIRLWVASAGLRKYLDKALDTYQKWGVEGIMVDFIERDDQEMVNWIDEMVRKAAAHHLTVTLHNVSKPTGLRRTYPNLLTREAVLNQEYDKWSPVGSTPEHELTVPFTRMLAGPLDFHQGAFRSVRLEDFRPRDVAPVVMSTRCHQLAMYVVYEDPMPMAVDYPSAYRKSAGIRFLSAVPTTWDETRFIDGAVSQYITIARRKGDDWYIGSMTNHQSRTVKVPLRFLPPGQYIATTWSDNPNGDPNGVIEQTVHVTPSDTITAAMLPAGGQVIHIRRALPSGSVPSTAPRDHVP